MTDSPSTVTFGGESSTDSSMAKALVAEVGEGGEPIEDEPGGSSSMSWVGEPRPSSRRSSSTPRTA